jgi:type I restriction enzyme M protein
MKSTGKGPYILPHGVLFRGNAEAEIRKNIIRRGFIQGIIGLPANLFYGTGTPAYILVLDKEHAASRKGIFMVDASKGFLKDGNKNRFREQDIHRIVDTFTRQQEIPKYSRFAPVEEIADSKNDYNLNISRYIDTKEAEDIQDIDAHLRGGIPDHDIEALAEIMPRVRSLVFEPLRAGYSTRTFRTRSWKATILGHADCTAVKGSVKFLAKWKESAKPNLKGFAKDAPPKALIETIAEDLLASFKAAPLLGMAIRAADYCPIDHPLRNRSDAAGPIAKELYEDWMRLKLKSAITPLIAKWQPILGVNVKGFFVQRMKTKRGSCSPRHDPAKL